MVDDEVELRVALRDAAEQRRLARCEKHDGNAGLLGRRPEPVRRSVCEPGGLLAGNIQPDAENGRLLLPRRKAASVARIVERNVAHGGETTGGSFRRFLTIVDTFPL